MQIANEGMRHLNAGDATDPKTGTRALRHVSCVVNVPAKELIL
jgi:hypothetical protein